MNKMIGTAACHRFWQRRWQLGLLALLFLALGACASERVQYLYAYDGDTITLKINGKKQHVRVVGVDTAEMRGKCAKERRQARAAQKFVHQLLQNAEEIRLKPKGRDRYARLLAVVYVDDKRLDQLIIRAKLGRKYQGGRRQSWCK